MLSLVPVSLKTANAFVAVHHRHHKPTTGHKFSIGCECDGQLVGVVIAGRPVSRYLDDGRTLEVNRLCTTGEKKCLQYALRRGGAGGKGHGLPQDHHLHAGQRTGGQPPGRWLDVYGTGRGKTLDRQTLSRCGPLPTADEAAL